MRFGQLTFAYIACIALTTTAIGCKGDIARALPNTASAQLRQDAKLCDRGDDLACHNVALEFDFGEARSDEGRALAQSLYERACENGRSLSCRRRAQLAVEDADGDLHAALKWLEPSCASGDFDACADIAEIKIELRDINGGMSDYFDLCHRNASRACIELGRHTLLGSAGTPDPAAAAELLDTHCVKGSPVACYYRAEALLAQTQSAGDIGREITHLLGQACVGGEALACRRLAGLHREGVGVTQDNDYARSLLRMSCEHHESGECDLILPPPTWAPADAPADAPTDLAGETP